MKKEKIQFAAVIIISLALILSFSLGGKAAGATSAENLKPENTNAWNLDYQKDRIEIPYKIPEYKVDVNQYDFDLEKIANKDQYSGFTENQKKMLEKNGFVVIQLGEKASDKMHHLYEFTEYNMLPTFITSDAILNMYHLFYSESMKYLELTTYRPKLVEINKSMTEKAIKAYKNSDQNTKEDLKIVAAYFGVGSKLLGIDTDFPKEIEKIVDAEIQLILAANKRAPSLILKEDLDYSQYTVRGHYTLNDELSSYFRTMMWYGQSGFQITKENSVEKIINHDNLAKSLMITTLLLDENSNDLKNWLSIYDLTDLYSGYSDDLNLLDFIELIKEVYGESPNLKVFRDNSYLEKLDKAVLNLRKPEISAKTEKSLSDINAPVSKEFRFMGQRYTLDSDILQNLVEPMKRPAPSALDVLSAFGSEEAESLLYKYEAPNKKWEHYEDVLNDMKIKVSDFTQEQWKSNLYNGWLWSIKAAATNFENNKKMPTFMQNKAWTHKGIATALASYTELKHDNILYAKQCGAECGGGYDNRKPHHYVEPNVELYSRLLWLIKYTNMNLEGHIDSKRLSEDGNILDLMEETLELLQTCSIKELNNEMLTEKELNELMHIGGLIDYVDNVYKYELQEKNFDIEIDDYGTTALVADIATVFANGPDGGFFVEEGIGMPLEIYVICPINGELYLTRGSVYSYYEFNSKERLTDAKWQEQLGRKFEIKDGYPNIIRTKSKLDLLEIMPWMTSYISDEKTVIDGKELEIKWDGYLDEDN